MVNTVIKKNNFVRVGNQPPTFLTARAAQAPRGRFSFPSLLVALALAAGCKTPLAVQGDYSNGKQTVSAAVTTTTNSVSVSGDFQDGSTNVGGTFTVGK